MGHGPLVRTLDVPEPTVAGNFYIAGFSSRKLSGRIWTSLRGVVLP
jgi:hypothetical protein